MHSIGATHLKHQFERALVRPHLDQQILLRDTETQGMNGRICIMEGVDQG